MYLSGNVGYRISGNTVVISSVTNLALFALDLAHFRLFQCPEIFVWRWRLF